MYQDNRPCEVCGSEVRLRSHEVLTRTEADDTVDDRVCTNDGCPTNQGDRNPDDPRP